MCARAPLTCRHGFTFSTRPTSCANAEESSEAGPRTSVEGHAKCGMVWCYVSDATDSHIVCCHVACPRLRSRRRRRASAACYDVLQVCCCNLLTCTAPVPHSMTSPPSLSCPVIGRRAALSYRINTTTTPWGPSPDASRRLGRVPLCRAGPQGQSYAWSRSVMARVPGLHSRAAWGRQRCPSLHRNCIVMQRR